MDYRHYTRALLILSSSVALAIGCTDGGGTTDDPSETASASSSTGSTDPSSTGTESTTGPGTQTGSETGTTSTGTDPTTGPGTTDPSTTDPSTTDPSTTDPGTTDPGTTDPSTTDAGTDSDTGVDPGDGIQVCGDDYPMDPLFVDAVVINGDTLTIDVSASGGCEEHEFGACWSGVFLESNPVQANLDISHNSNMDPCEAIIADQIQIDLTPIKQSYEDNYGMMNGTVMLNIDGWGPQVEYTF